MVLVDYRCPLCSAPIRGTDEVAYKRAAPLPILTGCQHCGEPLEQVVETGYPGVDAACHYAAAAQLV